MWGWGKYLRIVAVALPAALSGCAGLDRISTVLCDEATDAWQCVKSAPAFSRLNHNNNPHSAHIPDIFAAEYDRRHLSLVAADRKRRIETAHGIVNGVSPNSALSDADRKRYRRIKEAVRVDGGRLATLGRSAPRNVRRSYDRRWRVARQVIYLGGRPATRRAKTFAFSTVQASTAEIAFRSIATEALTVSGACDGPVELRQGRTARRFPTGRPFTFIVASGNRQRLADRLSPGKGTERCEIDVSGASGYRDHVAMQRDRDDHGIDGRYDVCRAPPLDGLPALERAFLSDRWLSQTCVMKPLRPKYLDDPRDGFNAKVDLLLGHRLSNAFIDAGDPMAPLDFSRAPKLDFIYMSYLDIKADFTGRIIDRLLRHHAARGVPIRIIVTEILERAKDRALLEAIAADYPNVQLQEFRWRPARGSAYDERMSGYYKTHHIKLLATLSRQKGRTRMIVGGRNLHDGFLYKEPLDLSRYPELQNYGATNGLSLNYYSNYRDFDIEIDDAETTRTVAAHFSTVWNRDFETNVSPPFSIQTNGSGRVRGMRHYISIPYADGQALENYYVELIDAAEKSIEIVNPYLNPPPAIEAAFERALDRGVTITVIARVNLKGDLGGQLLTELNELFIEKFADRMEMYEYLEPDVVLHSKLFMIDGRLSVVSSTNFNHRSFIHDSENGITMLDPAEYRRFKRVFEQYKAGATRLTADVDIPVHYRLLLSSKLLLEAL